jgi:hypothetical protein
MASYFFETITPANALAFNGAADALALTGCWTSTPPRATG